MNSNNNNSCKNNQEFLVNYALKTLVTRMMQFYMAFVKHGFTSNVTILTIKATNIYRVAMSHGVVSLVPIHSSQLVI